MTHHRYSPSSLESLELCPARARLSEGIEEVRGDDANEGTMLHERMAATNLNLEGLTAEQTDAVLWAVDRRDELCADQVMYWQEMDITFPVFVYSRNDYEHITGTADYVALLNDGKTAVLIDYKFGRNEITCSGDNLQMAAYALGVFTRFNHIEEITAVIVQPRIKAVSKYVYGRRLMVPIANTISAIIEKAESPSCEPIPGEKQCKYCRAKAHNKCAAVLNELNEIAIVNPENTGIMQISDLLDRCKIAEGVIKAIREKARAMLEQGEEIPGWHLATGAKVREIKDLNALYHVMSNIGISQSEFVSLCKIGIGDMEEAGINAIVNAEKQKGNKMTKKDAKAQLAAMTESIIVVKESAKRLERI